MSDQTQPATVVQPQPDQNDVEKNKTIAMLSYLIFFLPLVTDAKDSPFARFHANQALILTLFNVFVYVVGSILTLVFIGICVLAIGIPFGIVLFVLGIINANNGKMQRLPLIGGIDLIK